MKIICETVFCHNEATVKLPMGNMFCGEHAPAASEYDREDLEELALRTVSATNYYDLADNIDATSDNDLYAIIAADGDEAKENALATV